MTPEPALGFYPQARPLRKGRKYRRGSTEANREGGEAPDVLTDSTDAELVARALAGEAEAYTALVHRHYDPCARYARRMLGNLEDAEDVVQEVFLRAYLALGRYREQDRFRAWLFSILVNQCRTQARGRARRLRRFVSDNGADAIDPAARDGVELGDALQLVLETLEPLLRVALLLKYGEDLEYEEMSRLTGSSISALKMRVKRARDAVRPQLEGLMHE